MKRFSDLVIRFRVPVIAVTLAVTLALGYFIKDTRVNSDILSYLPKNDPTVLLNEHVGKRFGGTQLAVVALETDDVFTASCLAHVASLTAFRDYVLSRDLYRGRLVSEDGKATLVVARIDEAADQSVVAAKIRRTVERAGIPERVYYAGLPFQLIEINGLVVKDMIRLIPIAALLIVLSLLASFRSIRGVALPLVSVGISTVWVVGVMALLRVPFSLITNVIPVVLMATGSGLPGARPHGQPHPPGSPQRHDNPGRAGRHHRRAGHSGRENQPRPRGARHGGELRVRPAALARGHQRHGQLRRRAS